jgi:hypothetical protein
MNDTARQLRAQIPTSTDPEWLERMACHAESLPVHARRPAPAPLPAATTAPDLSDPISNLSAAVNTQGDTSR